MFTLENEEDVKNKLIVPYLLSLGFDISELSFEKSFWLRVGRSLHNIDTEKKARGARSRLDILVKRNGQNLLIVEVKGPNIVIDSDDIDQAVCYAKLLHPIAPVCLITNGQEWKLIDTLSKDELPSEKIGPHLPLNVTLPNELYYEALKHFFGYSRENILAFCQWQVTTYMRELRGSADDRDKKYIPELYEERRHLAEVTQQFMQSEAYCFATVGDSGSGKTCWACNDALHLLNQGVVTLFYRGADVADGILEAISRDLNWVLSQHYDDIQAVKRLLELFEHEQIVIWIDDIDGLPLASVKQILTEFLRRTEGYPIKLLLTCKSETWQDLLEEDGIPTPLASLVYRVNDVKGYRVGALNDQELWAVINKYRAFYHYSGSIDPEVLEMCQRVPFLLRVLFEVAASLSLPHIGYTVVNFLDEYFQKLCDRFGGQKDMIRRLLPNIALRFFEQNSNEIELDDLLVTLDIPLLQSLPERLFTLSILERTYREQTTYIGFYFQKLRDYLVAFRALKWQKKSAQDFLQVCSHLERHGVCLEVLNLYYTLTPLEEHKHVLDSRLYHNASAFLSLYEDVLNTHFPYLKRSFPPHSSNSIGFVGYVDFSHNVISGHGFRPLKDGNTKVLLLPTMPRAWMQGDKAYLAGLLRMHSTGSSRGFQNIDIADEVLSHNVQPSLKDIVQQGRLDESQNQALLIERVMATCLQDYAADFRRLRRTSQLLFPFYLEEVKTILLYKIAYDLLWHRLLDHHIAAGTAEETRDGPVVGHVIPMIPEELAEVEKQAWIIAREGKNVSGERNYRKVEDRELLLLEDVECLEKLGISEIARSPLTEWYEGGNQRRWSLARDVSYRDSLEKLLGDLFLTFLNEYRILVERNFPTLCQQFELYQKMPLTMFWALLEEEAQTWGVRPRSLLHQEISREPAPENTVVQCSEQKIEQNKQELRANPAFRGVLYTSRGLEFCTGIGNSHLPFKVSDSSPYILRKLVYKQIEDDLEKAFPFLASIYLTEKEV